MGQRMSVSVVIPALNEEANIERAVKSAKCAGCEVIVVDGGSRDGTKRAAKRAGARVISAQKGRATQLNAGAATASGRTLLFLHADSCLPDNWAHAVDQAMAHPADGRERHWGAFESIQIDADPLTAWLVRQTVFLRTRALHRPYGDQALFVQRRCFEQAGGFKEMPLLEDVDLVQRLKQHCGQPAIVPAAMATSGRRWQQLGWVKTTLINQAILVGHALGVDLDVLAALYQRTGHTNPHRQPHAAEDSTR